MAVTFLPFANSSVAVNECATSGSSPAGTENSDFASFDAVTGAEPSADVTVTEMRLVAGPNAFHAINSGGRYPDPHCGVMLNVVPASLAVADPTGVVAVGVRVGAAAGFDAARASFLGAAAFAAPRTGTRFVAAKAGCPARVHVRPKASRQGSERRMMNHRPRRAFG